MMKKGEMGLNLIVVAAIGLLVLVIISVIFVGKMSATRKNVDSCNANNGQCLPEEACSGNYQKTTTHVCDDEGLKCCVSV